jgi:hypothetical protein
VENVVGEERKVYKVLVGKSMEKCKMRSPISRCEDGFKMDIREIGWGRWSGFSWLRCMWRSV